MLESVLKKKQWYNTWLFEKCKITVRIVQDQMMSAEVVDYSITCPEDVTRTVTCVTATNPIRYLDPDVFWSPSNILCSIFTPG